MEAYCCEDYLIKIYEAPSYNPDSVDNKPYDKIIIIEESDFNKYLELEISKDNNLYYVLLVVPYHTPIDSCAVVSDNCLFLMLNDTLCLFSLESLDITKKVELDVLGTMFEAHAYKDDFILYGEIEIFRVNKNLDVIWSFSARDIFVRYKGDEPAFEMKRDRICLIDFLDYYYEIDYDGNKIVDRHI